MLEYLPTVRRQYLSVGDIQQYDRIRLFVQYDSSNKARVWRSIHHAREKRVIRESRLSEADIHSS